MFVDLQPEDSGEIGCIIDTQNVGAFENLTVYGKNVKLHAKLHLKSFETWDKFPIFIFRGKVQFSLYGFQDQ